MKKSTNIGLLVILLTLIPLVVNAQVVDDFSDGNFTNNPTWEGDIDEFEVNASNELHLIAPAVSDESHLVTANTLVDNAIWEFWVNMKFATSSTSKTYFYLMSDESNLESSLNGYYVLIGGTKDEVSLYRQGGNTSSKIIDGVDKSIETSTVTVRVKVSRDSEGNWELLRDITGGNSFTSEGSVKDNTYTSSSYLGFRCDYIASRSTNFYFDDVDVSSSAQSLNVVDVAVNNKNSIQVKFNQNVDQISSEVISNYTIDNSIDISTASRSESDKSVVILSVSDLTTDNYELNIANIEDELTNTPLPNPISRKFQYTQLELSSLITISDTELQLTFNDELDESSAQMLSNYSVDNSIGQPTSVTIGPADHKTLNLTFDNSFQPLTDYTLTYGGMSNSALNSEVTNGSTANFDYVIPLVIESIEVLSKNQLKLTFNLDLDQNTAEETINYSIDNNIGNPQSAVLGETNLKEITLSLQSDLRENNYTITLNNVEDKANHPIEPNTSALYSYLPLTIASIAIVDETNIDVTFNQNLDKTSAETVSNYVIDFEVGTAISAALNQSDSKIVRITFGNIFVNNDYNLTVNGVENSSGNALAENGGSLIEVELPTRYRQIVINEIFADPTPTIGLPSSEFVELHNVSDRSVNVGEFELTGGTISDFILAPGGFVILASTSDAANYDTYENVVTVSSWNTLSNGGEQMLLRDNLGNLVDSISFSDDWHESAKSDGGWTLEQINPALACNYQANWTSSINSDGGTPGSINSIFDNSPDEVGPNLINVTVFNGDKLRLFFDEPMEAGSLTSGAYLITLELSELSYFVDNSSTFSVDLVLQESLVSGNNYEINAISVTDCAGNAILTTSFFLEYDIEPPVLERIIISSLNSVELVFDEDLNENEGEEEDNFDVNNDLSLPKSATLNDEDPSHLYLSFDKDFIPLLSNSITISNLQDTKGNALTSSIVTSFLYEQSIDTIIVRSINQLDLEFKELVDEQSAIEVSNYSLSEDIGAPSLIYQDDDNDKLFHLIFEINFKDNSKLILTVRDIKYASGEYLPTPEYDFIYDTKAPKVLGLTTINETTLQVDFDEQVESKSAQSIENYYYEEVFANTRTLAQNDSTVILEFEEPFERERILELSIDNVQDLSGNAISTRIKKEFVYDIFPPELDSILVISPKALLLVFNEEIESISATELTNYFVEEGIGNPLSIKLDSEKQNQIILTFSTIFPELMSIDISISALEDARGNKLANSITATFDYSQFLISKIEPVNQNQIEIEFNKSPKEATSLDGLNYSVNRGSVSQITNPDAQNTRNLLLEVENDFEDDSQNVFVVSNLLDENDNPLSTQEYSFSFDSKFSELRIINENTLELEFEIGLNPAELPDKSIFELIPNELSPLALIIDSEDNKLLRLTFSENFQSNISYSISWPQLTNEFGNLIPGFSTAFMKDESAPEIMKIQVHSEESITIVFSDALDQKTTDIVSNYELSPESGTLEEVDYNDSDSSVHLRFSQPFVDGTIYSLTINNIKDQSGNLMPTTANNFTYKAPYIPKPGELLFTEIMADPSPSIGLPESEYLEIFNNSEEEIILNKLVLSDGTGSTQLNNDTLRAKSYLLIVPATSKDLFSVDNVIGISNFPSLGNSSDSLVISLEDKTIIDQVVYLDSWYRDENKNGGGYSLERLSLEGKCIPSLNWIASADAQGGTPGRENSLFNTEPDKEAPKIEEIEYDSNNSIEILFNEAMDSVSIQSGSYSFSGGLKTDQLILSGDLKNELKVTLESTPLKGQLYTLIISELNDCAGNNIEPYSFSFGIGKIPEFGDLIITEIMSDPSPSKGLPEVEYLEIYNNSTKFLELEGVLLNDRTSSISLEKYLISPKGYLLLTSSNSSILYSIDNVIGISNFPSLGNSSDSLVISLEDKTIIDQVVYSDSWYRDGNKNGGGYSLERLSLEGKCIPSLNWIASADAQGGTPGRENSLFNTEPDKEAPKIEEISFVSSNTLEITFSEAMDFESLKNGSYVINNDLQIDELIPSGKEKNILTIALTENPKEGKIYELTITNVSDCAGNLIELFTYNFGVGGKPMFNELLITEIMADPDPEVGLPQSEYLELYNASDKNLELLGLILQDENGSTELPMTIMLPKSYLLLVPSGSTDLFDGIDVLAVSNWRSLSNGGETISIYNSDELIFSTSYNQNWYKDSSKKEGGWSLEMIDLSNPCGEINNWTASEDVSGGTPGSINSVLTNNPDNFGPQLVIAIAQDERNLKLVFDEKLNPDQFVNSSFDIEPQIGVSNIYLNEPINNEALMSLTEPLSPKVEYIITVTSTTDCVGNFIRNEANQARFSLPETGVTGDIVLNEILFNPRSGGVDFVEVYNKSNKAINLKSWQLANYKNDGAIDPDIISEDDLIFQSGAFLVFTSDPVVLKADYPTSDETTFVEMSPFPRYSDSNGSAILLDSLDNIIDLFDYDSDFHFNLLDDVDGVSLERINFDGDTNEPSNWKSAASTAGFATPGLMNSQFKSKTQVSGMLTIEPKVFIPDNTGMNDFTTINYEFQNTGNFANVNIYDAAGRLVKTIVQGDLLSTTGFFTWDGTNNSGSRARAGYYAIYFEIFDSEGNKDMIKETVVLGVRF